MNTLKSILRITALLALVAVGIVGVFSVPDDNSLTWMTDVLLSKTIGVAAFYAFSKLYSRWSKTDPWIHAYDSKH